MAKITKIASEKNTRPAADRLWEKVIKKGPDECWVWYRTPKTYYPIFGFSGGKYNPRHMPAHRAAYILAHGEPPAGAYICHKCGNRLCCNPNHLYAGTAKSNVWDAIRHGTFKFLPMKRGCDVHNAKIDEETVRAIRLGFPKAINKQLFALSFNITYTHCRRIALGRGWNHVD